MADEPENLTLLLLRRLDESNKDIKSELSLINRRLVSMDANIISTRREILNVEEGLAAVNIRLDFHKAVLDRVSKRLDLLDEGEPSPPGVRV